ncbi:orotate phosphoribosyltransferase [Legionella maceachernii]|uniref:Orotate phosphoribosyltransferase n=1 Tax=Legionella maceachernii TaxID=466 RepID=A0A0W0VWM3_9GAMM|nr:hypothetical protein [Legionella maceachernii]KTD24435.1 Orotate phosphoribosyltransferase [Legionella maceachernii]SJZ66933.1 orotate phosphoribosyltransferase [Legionella maceachernii]SUP01998.1 Orotate phosphoribosyltransferase [Legionella maceachernii]
MTTIASLTKRYIEGIYQTKAFMIKESPMTLHSGKKSHVYLNHRQFLTNTDYLTVIAKLYFELIQSKSSDYCLGIVDSIMSPIIVGAMSVLFKKNYVIIQKKAMGHGTQESIFGTSQKPIVLIDDMTSTGETLIDAAHKIREKGGVVNYAVISAYRETNALDNLRSHDIEPLAIASFNEIVNTLFESFTEQEKMIVQQYPLIMD